MKLNYYNFQGFENIFLEDSFVLNIETDSEINFYVEVVLTEKHLLYSKPKQNEVYCYRKALIQFSNAESIKWLRKEMISSTDVTGEIDFGNIDEMFLLENKYYVNGDWGELEIVSSPPIIKFD